MYFEMLNCVTYLCVMVKLYFSFPRIFGIMENIFHYSKNRDK